MNPSSHSGAGPKNGPPGRARPNLLGAKTGAGAQVASESGLGDYRILAEFDGSESRRTSGPKATPWGALIVGGVLVVGAALAWSQWSARKSATPVVSATAAAATARDANKGVNVATAVQAVPAAPATGSKFDVAAPIEAVAPAAPAVTEGAVAATAAPATKATERGASNVKPAPKAAPKAVAKEAAPIAVAKAPAVSAQKANTAKPAVVVAKAATADTVKPPTAATSATDNSALAPPASAVRVQRDPDEDLIAALIAHLSRSKANPNAPTQAAALASGTMDQLARCVAAGQSTTDCRARLCEGRWGKDAACPQPLPARP